MKQKNISANPTTLTHIYTKQKHIVKVKSANNSNRSLHIWKNDCESWEGHNNTEPDQ